jgi:hypothetical protein
MKTAKGVIQGYVGVAAVDQKNQVIVNAEVFGQGHEHDLLVPSLESIHQNFEAIGHDGDVFKETKLTADSGYHSEENMEGVFSENIDGYIADPNFRKRDPRISSAERYKELQREKTNGKIFTSADLLKPALKKQLSCRAVRVIGKQYIVRLMLSSKQDRTTILK